jgi:hypothetical protein
MASCSPPLGCMLFVQLLILFNKTAVCIDWCRGREHPISKKNHRSSAYLGDSTPSWGRTRLPHAGVRSCWGEKRQSCEDAGDCLQILKGLKSVRPSCRGLMLARSHGRPFLRARCLPTSRSDGVAWPLPFSHAPAAMPWLRRQTSSTDISQKQGEQPWFKVGFAWNWS